ncbi:hypothetical protein, partial [Paraburkholderia hospita]|uniref:hypothetical protein n=1 Tax=Paraburkholderia hospita TaxID=169430 RepID=UPI001A98B659
MLWFDFFCRWALRWHPRFAFVAWPVLVCSFAGIREAVFAAHVLPVWFCVFDGIRALPFRASCVAPVGLPFRWHPRDDLP